MIPATGTTRARATWPKLIPTNTNLPIILKTKFKTKRASNKDTPWENFQVNKHNKNSLLSLRQTFSNSRSIKTRKISEDNTATNLLLPNNFRTKTSTILETQCKKRMIIINMIKTLVSSSISKIHSSKTNKTSNKTLSLKERDFKWKSNSQLYYNLFKSNKNITVKSKRTSVQKNKKYK